MNLFGLAQSLRSSEFIETILWGAFNNIDFRSAGVAL